MKSCGKDVSLPLCDFYQVISSQKLFDANHISLPRMNLLNMDLLTPTAYAAFIFCVTLLGYRLYFNVPDRDIYEIEKDDGEDDFENKQIEGELNEDALREDESNEEEDMPLEGPSGSTT